MVTESMRLHETVLWSVQADRVRKDLERCRDMNARAFRWHWVAAGAAAYVVAHIRHEVTSMLEQMELWLRARIGRQLSIDHHEGWWSAIPGDIRRRADLRYRVACEEFRERRAGAAHSTDWLSFGDLLKMLAAFRPESWRSCLDATVRRTPQAHGALADIKSFRDSRVAHLYSGGPTRAEIWRLVASADRLCQVLRPQDYVLSIAFRRSLSGITGKERKCLTDVYSAFRKPRATQAVRLRTLDRVLPSLQVGPARDVELLYCDALIREADAAAGMVGALFGDA